jgi:hypothetical protein
VTIFLEKIKYENLLGSHKSLKSFDFAVSTLSLFSSFVEKFDFHT